MSENKKFSTDIVIIGAGPVGLFAAFEAGMLKMKTHIVDALDFIGGQCTALYPEKPIYDIPAFPKISAADLIDNLHEQIKPFKPEFHLGNQVVKLDKLGDNKCLVTTSKNIEIECTAIIIAAGCGAFGPNRPPLENLETYEKSGQVDYLVKRIAEYKDKNVVIAGGGDSAVDWALSLSEVAKKVSVVHRRAKFRAAPNNVEQLHKLAEEGKIDLVVPFQLDCLIGENDQLQYVGVKDLDGNKKQIEADVLLPFFGLAMELGPIADWGLNLENKYIKVEASTMETNIPGIFAVGDIATYAGKLKLILTGFSESALAAHEIYNYVYPDTPLHFEYSTTKKVSNAG